MAAPPRCCPACSRALGGYDLTYGSLAGVMIALIFFFIDRAGRGDRRRTQRGAGGSARERARGTATNKEVNGVTGLMQGKRGLIMGLANDRSLAWGIAKKLARAWRRAGVQLSGRGAGEARAPARRATGQRFPDRLRRVATWPSSTRPSRRWRSAGRRSTSSSMRSAFRTRTSCAAAMSTPASTIS